jgi:uncharacterized repeat protein (TIGR01451 family)
MPTTGLSSPFYIFKFTAAIDPDDANRFLAGDFYDGINIFENYVPDFGASSADVVDENGGDRIAGDTATYTVTVENDGPADAHAVELSVSVPNGAEFVPGSAQIDSVTISDPASPTFSLSLGTLLRGESVTVTFGFAGSLIVTLYICAEPGTNSAPLGTDRGWSSMVYKDTIWLPPKNMTVLSSISCFLVWMEYLSRPDSEKIRSAHPFSCSLRKVKYQTKFVVWIQALMTILPNHSHSKNY